MVVKNKRYYWIQLAQDFFKSKEMKLLRKIAGGDTHTIIYLKMMLISLEDGGHIYYDGLADNLAEEIALVIDENVEDIKITLIFLESKGLLTRKNDRVYFLEQVPEMVGSETASARRVRKSRENKRVLHCNNDVTKCIGDIDIDIEIDTEIEKDIDENPVALIVEEYQSRIAPLDGTQFELLKEFITLDGMEAKVVLKAIGLAADNGKRNFSYIRAILTNWKNDGVLTIAAVDERERAYKESKNSKRPGNQKSNVPEWSQPNYVNKTSDETKKDLEKKKQEMLEKLEKGIK
ncbi:phage replisome organizer N-terminal domain-containing protein [Streptococcus oralis]|uniref:Phage replisome organizer N-terminal domain-containing protein n=1 Tax=Streptococcus oralis TaxID=1303 RepID=A0A7T3DYL6_STROR|nr:phage replisome organizer N-terminal domain-containing protein [Streptococcus oralis]QBX17266.1 replication initiation protein [Streptococcus phage Javan347]QPT02232.1 phage replisome organizer N-terminal domain-containing protein [Streptococcus oralis]CAK1607823.1 Phage replisome organizer N-terminal domain-containing protein [Streptococcus oralis subsp. dentisani]